MDQDQETMPTRMENIASTASCKIKFRRTVLRESETKNHPRTDRAVLIGPEYYKKRLFPG